MSSNTEALVYVCEVLVTLGMVPVVASLTQFLIVGLHRLRDHYGHCEDYTPRVAIIVPAWNEGLVIANSIDMLMQMDYPPEALRVMVVDDASTDSTPEVVTAKAAQYAGRVFHLRRDKGGQGKAHTLNHGLSSVLADDWAQAVLVMDADVLFEPLTLRRMARHLADPQVGAVTAYIKEGSDPGGMVARFIAFEYITAQAAARRAQNLLGAMACLAGGAQLHARASLEAIGGKIDTTTLAEDTYTTLLTQLHGRKVVFDGNAVVWAEEPDTLDGLWKQRLRWARGNLQITSQFRWLWFRPWRGGKLSSMLFGLLWFSIVLMPVLMILASIGLVGLYLLNPAVGFEVLGGFWGINAGVHLFITFYSFAIDPGTARRAWFQGMMFPGLVAVGMMVFSFVPEAHLPVELLHEGPRTQLGPVDAAMLILCAWTSVSMLAAWVLYRLEKRGLPNWLRNPLLVVVGFGPVLCAIILASYISELRKTGMQWDKTEKSGKARMLN